VSNKTTAQRNARRLQRLAEDELGIRPKLTTCHNILRDTPRNPLLSIEEQIAAMFLAHRDLLKASAERREASRQDQGTT
jgi:hypothetical protein